MYIYIIYTPNLGLSASVLDPEQEQGRCNRARREAARKRRKKGENAAKKRRKSKQEQGRTVKGQGRTMKKHKKEHRSSY